MRITCRADRWLAPPGSTVMVEEMGPFDGRWLVTAIERGLFDREATVSVRKPIAALPEPAPETEQIIARASAAGTGPRAAASEGQLTGASLSGTTPDMIRFGKLVAGVVGRTLSINSAKRNGGGDSNHDRGNALDFCVTCGVPGDEICAAVLIVCGMDPQEARRVAAIDNHPSHNFSHNRSWQGHSVEIGWRTMTGGNHYNHVHAGFDS